VIARPADRREDGEGAEVEEVRMGVDEPRHQGRAAQVERRSAALPASRSMSLFEPTPATRPLRTTTASAS
jgi:hypothetical protein